MGTITLILRADSDCAVYCDGDVITTLNASQVENVNIQPGQHIVQFVSLDYEFISQEIIIDCPIPGKQYLAVARGLYQRVQNQRSKERIAIADSEKRKTEQERMVKVCFKWCEQHSWYLQPRNGSMYMTQQEYNHLLSGGVSAAYAIINSKWADRLYPPVDVGFYLDSE